MKKRLYRALPAFAMIVMLAGCGKDVDVESAETAVDTVETMEMEEEETEDEEPKASYYTGYNHYIDPEEAGKTAESETEIKEEDQDAADTASEAETAASGTTENKKEETKAASQTQDSTPASEAVPTPEPVPEVAAEPAPSIPDKSQLNEWMPPKNMLFVSDANIVDENGNVLGSLSAGCDIGVTGECPGFYQVNYGAVRSFVVKSALAPNN